MGTKHTPGPWMAVRDSGFRHRIQTSGDKGTLAYMTARPFAHSANFSCQQIADNARLIAAAPELLAACQKALQELRGIAEWTVTERAPLRRQELEGISERRAELSAAIAKATDKS